MVRHPSLRERLGRALKPWRSIPGSPEPAFGEVSERPFERNRAADLTEAAARLDYRPRVTLQAGLQRTVEYYSARLRDASVS